MSLQRIILCTGEPGENKEVIVNLAIEEHNREDVIEVVTSAIELIYDGVDDADFWSNSEGEPSSEEVANA